MLNFVRNWFRPRSNPIGIDFGTDALRMAQVQFDGNDFRLIAAATAEIPARVRFDESARFDFFTHALRALLVQGQFQGRLALIGLPSAWTVMQQIRMARLEGAARARVLMKEAATRLQIDLSQSLLRHIVAGEMPGSDGSESQVILLAARRAAVDQLLKAAGRAGLEVMGIVPEPSAMVDCFTHVYRRKADANSTTCCLDIGASGTRMVVNRGSNILSMCSFALGGQDLNNAVAMAFDVDCEDAQLLRRKLAQGERESIEQTDRSGTCSLKTDRQLTNEKLETALALPLAELAKQICTSLREHERVFARLPADRILLCGGEARCRFVCEFLAREIGLPAQVGDPMLRLSRNGSNYAAGIIDRRQPQPVWAIALGLTMGPAKNLEIVSEESTAFNIENKPNSARDHEKEAA